MPPLRRSATYEQRQPLRCVMTGLTVLANYWRPKGWTRDGFVLIVLAAGLGHTAEEAGAAWDAAPDTSSGRRPGDG